MTYCAFNAIVNIHYCGYLLNIIIQVECNIIVMSYSKKKSLWYFFSE